MKYFVNPGRVTLLTRLYLTARIGVKFFKSTKGWCLYTGDQVSSVITIDIK